MGKAQIQAPNGSGNYTVTVLHNRERIEAEIADLVPQQEDLQAQQDEIEERLDLAELEVEEARILMDALISDWESSEEVEPPDMQDLIDAHNILRGSKGVGSLIGSEALHVAAQDHASWLRNNDIGGHTGEGGSTPGERIITAGFEIFPDGEWGENVAVGTVSIERSMAGWLASPGHYANQINPEWEYIGVGYARRTDGPYRHFWVVTFGRAGTEQTVQTGPPLPVDLLLQGDPMDLPEALENAQIALVEAAAARDIIRVEHNALLARKTALDERLQALQDIPPDPELDVWCADYSESLSGVVATAEIPGEGNQRVIIRPGYDPSSVAYEPARDGQLFHREGMTGPQAYLLAAMLPGWQKWMPTYRVGVLTSVDKDNDVGTVVLDFEGSSAQGLPINQQTTLAGIPIQYMTCNAEVFEVDDRVLVEFPGRDWTAPRVIGFESEPKPCFGVIQWPAIQFRIRATDDQFEEAVIYDNSERYPEYSLVTAQCVGGTYDGWNAGFLYYDRAVERRMFSHVWSNWYTDSVSGETLPRSELYRSAQIPELENISEGYDGILGWELQRLRQDCTSYSGSGSNTGYRARHQTELTEINMRNGSTGLLQVIKIPWTRAHALEDLPVRAWNPYPPCDDIPTDTITTNATAGDAIVEIDTTDLNEIRDWVIAQGMPATFQMEHIPSGQITTYRLSFIGRKLTGANTGMYVNYSRDTS